ncbi:MAG TPA: FG-GAP-like repeat-containing protein [Rhizomicrobium sp.]|nr:FG-GAP-like repeat-containing protein [Rhizomicrobium sp.]
MSKGWALAVLLLAATPAQADAPAMTVPGRLDVNASGAATYAIPILVPPGTAGLAPALTLNYSSQSGNGMLGFGWSLGGLPSIARCPQTYAQDGAHGGVAYNADDRFCLDGQRLLLVNGPAHNYGDEGSEYRTEIESFAKVIAHNVSGVVGPGWFEVHTKSGQVLELGNSLDSRILAQGKTAVRVWAANKIGDTAGNYLSVVYAADQGQYYPDHIFYTGNANAHTAPYNAVYFRYEPRGDPSTLYHAGSLVVTAKLLQEIDTYTNTTGAGAPASAYKLDYQLGNAPYSQLKTVTRCDGAGNCLAPTTFTWQTASTWPTRIVIDATVTLPRQLASGTYYAAADFNGDGIVDGVGLGDPAHLCSPVLYNSPLFLGTPDQGPVPADMTEIYSDGTSATACLVSGNPTSSNGILGDIDGDGFTDMYNTLALFRNNGDGTFSQIGHFGFGSASQYDQPQDYNADGRPADGYGFNATSHILSFGYSKGDGTYGSSQYTIGGDSTTIARAAGDADGDGCPDIIVQNAVNEVFSSCNPSHPLPIADFGPTGPASHGSQGVWGDFNGDGNADYLFVPCSSGGGGHATLNISTGTAFLTSTPAGMQCGPYGTNQFFVGDYDGDGKSDVIMVDRNGMYVYTWNGSGLVQVISQAIHLPQPDCSGFCGNGYDGALGVTDVDSDGCSDLLVSQGGPSWYYKFGCHPPLLMTGIDNGIGAATTIAYRRLNANAPFYVKCPDNPARYACGDAYPTQAVDGPIYAVSEVDTGNGIGGTFSTNYAYAGAKNDLLGRGFLGFQTVVATDGQTHVVQTTRYNTLFPLTGTVLEQTRTLNGVVLSDTIHSYAAVPAVPVMGTPTFVYESASTVTGHEIDGTALPSTTAVNSNPDAYGNIQNIGVTVSDGSSKTTQNLYSNDPSRWLLGRLVSTTVTSRVGASQIVRSSSFAYDLVSGVLNQEVIEPNAMACNGSGASCRLQTDYTLDAFGHRQKATVSGSGIATRASRVDYDANGSLQRVATNALGQAESFDYSGANGLAFGVPTGHTDIDGIVTLWSYDGFGRRTHETRQGLDGTQSALAYLYCSGVNQGTASCPAGAAFVMQVTPLAADGATQNGPMTKAYFDALSRPIATDVQGFDGPGHVACGTPCWIRTATHYDDAGRIAATSRPYFVTGGMPQWTVNDYGPAPDPYGRPAAVTAPDGSVTRFAYTGLGNQGGKVSVTNALSQTTATARNAQGLVASVTNALGKTTTYVYDAYGDVLTVTDPVGNRIVNTYDLRGNKLSSSDPDMGLWRYSYDVLGELLSQTDAKGQATSLSYDLLGRVLGRVEPDLTSSWSYDPANGIGALGQAVGSAAGYGRTLSYDVHGRPVLVSIVVNGASYPYRLTYNADGRLDTLRYPSGLVVRYAYTPLGYLYQLKDDATGAVLWTANARDAELHLADEVSGNGVRTIRAYDPATGLVQQIRAGSNGQDNGRVAHTDTDFDAVGNLSSRYDAFGPYTEYFCYDGLNRLTATALGGAGCTAPGGAGTVTTVGYDDIGNIVSRSDLGAYSYPAPGSARPHAVGAIAGTVNGIVGPHYKYDPNGNLVCVYTGGSCIGSGIVRESAAWWSFNMAKTVSEGTSRIDLVYGPEHDRIVQTATDGSTSTTTTYLNDAVSGAMSETVVTAGAVTWNDYLSVDGRLVAERSCAGAASCSATWSYFVTDHLGSVAVVTDQSSAVTANGRLSFDPWGRQRNPNGSADPTCALPGASPTTHTFTGQEAIASLCLVNLNARLYDPTIGRFLSPDSIVPDPTDAQSYNRYSYVDNRPLSFTDPTGHDPSWFDANPPGNDHWTGNGGQYTDEGSNPGMSVVGGFSIIETTYGDDRGPTFKITYNSDGDARLGPDRTAGEVSTGTAKATNDSDSSRSNSDPKSTGQTGASDYVQTTAITSEIDPATGGIVTTASDSGHRSLAGVQVAQVQIIPEAIELCAENPACARAAAALGGATVAAILNAMHGIKTKVKSRNDDPVPLYRAVSAAELADIQTTGQYRPAPGQMEGKLFALTMDQAEYYLHNPRMNAAAIVTSSVSRETFDMLQHETMDRMPAVFAPSYALSAVNADANTFGGIKQVQ